MRTAPLYTDEMCILSPADDPLVDCETVSLADLLGRHWVGLLHSRVHRGFAEAAAAASPHWSEQHRAGRPTEAQLLVLSGLGLALAGAHEPLIPGLAFCPLTEPLLTRTIGIAEVRGRPSSIAALALSRLLRAQTYAPGARSPAAASTASGPGRAH